VGSGWPQQQQGDVGGGISVAGVAGCSTSADCDLEGIGHAEPCSEAVDCDALSSSAARRSVVGRLPVVAERSAGFGEFGAVVDTSSDSGRRGTDTIDDAWLNWPRLCW
jgi:hypothetical protein